ncbi:pirin-like C-terminal cupin domain-containing protein [Marinobacterium aestuariivivens]|uniref:Pirin-like C-terminal cupin domain-containing protein n=1 Tax=Marinobacterium aestuariivivens TaxID=1698799 RepID=A0ABW2A1V9_9GAMM
MLRAGLRAPCRIAGHPDRRGAHPGGHGDLWPSDVAGPLPFATVGGGAGQQPGRHEDADAGSGFRVRHHGAQGALKLEGQGLSPGSLCYLGGQRRALEVALSAGSCCILLGGIPVAEPVKIWWNFVAHREETIRSALDDWNNGRRFLPVSSYEGPALKAPEWPQNGRLK